MPGVFSLARPLLALTFFFLCSPHTCLVVGAGAPATRPKPFPDPYLQACAVLGVDSRATVAIEDSPNGLRSAVASGAAVIGVPHMVSITGAGAHAVWPTLAGRTAQDVVRFHSGHVQSVSPHSPGDTR
jgi:beta-phosphoglucomutase-like phosphatase (HAD superfamily)